MAIFHLLSMSHGQATFLIALTTFILYLFLRKYAERRVNPHGLPYPPGPKPLPIIGNVLDIARENEAQAYQQLAKEHGRYYVIYQLFASGLTRYPGDLVFLSALGKHILFVNSFKHAYELFERRSANYADRATSVMSNELYVRLRLPLLDIFYAVFLSEWDGILVLCTCAMVSLVFVTNSPFLFCFKAIDGGDTVACFTVSSSNLCPPFIGPSKGKKHMLYSDVFSNRLISLTPIYVCEYIRDLVFSIADVNLLSL